jgi:hypothetical protein
VLAPAGQPNRTTARPFGLPLALWAGAAGACVVLALVLTLAFWPKKKTDPVDKGPPGADRPEGAPLWSADKAVSLPGAAARVVVAGNGRFLVLHLKERGKLLLFDVLRGEVAHELPGDDSIYFAAGATRLVVLEPATEKARIYGLDGKEQRVAPLPPTMAGKQLHAVCMGSASEGPVFFTLPHEKRTLTLDLTTLTTTEVRWPHFGPDGAAGPNYLRPSPDGTMLLGYGGGWEGLCRVTFEKGKQVAVNDKYHFKGELSALPSADGKWVFTARGMFSQGLALVEVPHAGKAYFVPAREPGYYLALLPKGRSIAEVRERGMVWGPIEDAIVYSEDRQQLFSLDRCEELRDRSTLRFEERIHYYPRAGMLVVLSGDGGRVVLRRFPPPKAGPSPAS